jgi:hypothetical protein
MENRQLLLCEAVKATDEPLPVPELPNQRDESQMLKLQTHLPFSQDGTPNVRGHECHISFFRDHAPEVLSFPQLIHGQGTPHPSPAHSDCRLGVIMAHVPDEIFSCGRHLSVRKRSLEVRQQLCTFGFRPERSFIGKAQFVVGVVPY